MTPQPKISVIIPVYNVEKYLRECLDSVINQTLPEIEIICINDCSTDDSLNILREYAEKDQRIRVVTYDTNKSASQARKDGVQLSSGKYIVFLDGDDRYETYAFAELYAQMERHKVDILQFGTYIDAEPGIPEQTLDFFKKFSAPYQKRLKGKEIFESCFVRGKYGFTLWNKIYKSELCKKAFSYVEDGVFPKAQDLYAFFIISWFAQSYYGITKQYYHYAYGRGITGENKNLSAVDFSRNCSQSRVAEKCKQFLGEQNAWDMYKTAWGVLYSNLLNECCNLWFKNISQEMSAKAFDILVDSFGADEVNAALEKTMKDQKEKIAAKARGAACLPKFDKWFFPVYDADPNDAQIPDGFEKVVPVVFATNNKYAPYAGVAIQSIIEHMVQQNFYRIYVFHTGIEKNYIEQLNSLSNKQMRVRCVDVSSQIDAHCSRLYEKGHFTKEMYYRFIIPEVLPFYDKVIYLDCDLIVEEDIANIIPQNMGHYYLAGVKNPLRQRNIPIIEQYLGISLQNYINSGVLVFNVADCVKDGITAKCFETVPTAAKKKYWCPDQDILNRVCIDRILILPYKWNFMWQFFVEETLEQPEMFREIVDEVGNNFSILHFTSPIKPWSHPRYPLARHFWQYARKSYFYEDILQNNILDVVNKSVTQMQPSIPAAALQHTASSQVKNNYAMSGAETDRVRILERELADALMELAKAQNEIQNIHNSWTYRIGRFVTFIPRKIRGGIRCYREHGMQYTLERLCVHLHLKKDPYK